MELVTEVDDLSENYLLKQIGEKYPGHAVLSEESGARDISSEYQWIIDPLDGTTNYAQGLPVFSISVVLKYKKETVLGVVYVPLLNECLLATGFPYDKAVNQDNNASYFANMVPEVMGIRRMGSAAYDLANVAAGIYDGFWESI